MGIVLGVTGLLAVTAAGTNDSVDTDGVCIEAELRRVNVTTDKLPVALLAITRRVTDPDSPWQTSDAAFSWESWARELLDTHRDIQVNHSITYNRVFLY